MEDVGEDDEDVGVKKKKHNSRRKDGYFIRISFPSCTPGGSMYIRACHGEQLQVTYNLNRTRLFSAELDSGQWIVLICCC